MAPDRSHQAQAAGWKRRGICRLVLSKLRFGRAHSPQQVGIERKIPLWNQALGWGGATAHTPRGSQALQADLVRERNVIDHVPGGPDCRAPPAYEYRRAPANYHYPRQPAL